MYSLIFLFKSYAYPKFQTCIKAKFIYTLVYLCNLAMCDSEEFCRFCVKLIRAYAKRQLIINSRNAIKLGKIIYLVTVSITVLTKMQSELLFFMFVACSLSNTYRAIREQCHDKDYRLNHCSTN